MSNTNLTLDASSTQKLKQETAGQIAISPSRLGDMAEQYVKLLAHWKGCEVFSNVGCTGDTDLVIIHPELGSLRIDVKCSTYGIKDRSGRLGWQTTGSRVNAPGVYAVEVRPAGDFTQWNVRWRNEAKGRNARKNPSWVCPPGWEDFWSNDNRIYTTTYTKHNDL